MSPAPALTSTATSSLGPTRRRQKATARAKPPYHAIVPAATPSSRPPVSRAPSSDGAAAGTDSVRSAIVSGFSEVAASAVSAQKRCCQELLHRGTLGELLSATWVARTIPMAAILPLRYWASRVIS
jgi:hypothetical protein